MQIKTTKIREKVIKNMGKVDASEIQQVLDVMKEKFGQLPRASRQFAAIFTPIVETLSISSDYGPDGDPRVELRHKRQSGELLCGDYTFQWGYGDKGDEK